VNFMSVSNSTAGNPPQLMASGSDPNVNILFVPKGSGYVQVFAPAGGTPQIRALTPDANSNLNLVSRGIGVVQANGFPVGAKVAIPVSLISPGRPGEFSVDATGMYAYTGDGTAHTWSGVVTGATQGTAGKPLQLWTGTKAQYDAIATKSASTIYVVTTATAVTGDITVDEGAETGDIAVEPPAPEVVADETAAEPKAAPATKSTRKK
jgi:hypothetical protein